MAAPEGTEFSIKYIPSFFLTNVLQGKGFVRLFPERFEVNGRRYWKARYIALLVLAFLLAGAIPGLLLIYLVCRRRATIAFQYNDVVKFSRTLPNRCSVDLRFSGDRIQNVRFSLKDTEDLDSLEGLLKKYRDLASSGPSREVEGNVV